MVTVTSRISVYVIWIGDRLLSIEYNKQKTNYYEIEEIRTENRSIIKIETRSLLKHRDGATYEELAQSNRALKFMGAKYKISVTIMEKFLKYRTSFLKCCTNHLIAERWKKLKLFQIKQKYKN